MTFVVLALVVVAAYAAFKHFDAAGFAAEVAVVKADVAKAHAALVAVSAKVEASVKTEVDAVIADLKKWL